ncbi:DUF6542 domain-containing protein [Streptomyces justiciae]|uniref:DUF6542 domain-containing protein n=1 Tax=Streptomyces justiciae TaxID=2780140 RepID=A0ABU3LP61_9ACTN|nr:DUF6542 domain-containing protein [Streptomyces justiciae]MBE8472337.1 hypothetical protein [Streptomyces justiciae]MCW8383188.1 hypothetical protein [Streptomyces justiciae]MDT7841025.1 hypothetical protein [Streptomyces justiciae]
MEQHRTRPPHIRARRETASLPPQAARGGRPPARPAAVRRPAPPAVQAVRRFPNPRLTGLGGGLFCIATMLLLGCLDALTFGSLTVYGVLFLPVCVLTAVWVRRNDLVTAPVVVPIAFAAGVVPVAEGGDGLGARLMGLVTALATQAGWLYGGTLIAGLIVTVRKVSLMARRRRANRRPV